MGNASSYMSWSYFTRSSDKQGDVVSVTEKSNVPVMRTVEDIQKLTIEDIEEQFDKLYRTSNTILYSIAHNPCDQLAERIKNCITENNQKMSKCFGVMGSYRSCVSDFMEKKLADVVTDYENASTQTRLLDGTQVEKPQKQQQQQQSGSPRM